jgi:type II secretory pathway pseudopilin PulG
MIELLIVLAIAMVLAVMAIPWVLSATRNYRLAAAVSAATGAIQSTRYAEIMNSYPGYGYELVFTPSTNSYQVYTMIPPATTYSAQVQVGTATYNTTPVPICRPGDATISRSVTYQFNANGTVTETSNPVNMCFQITNNFGGSRTICVSQVGNVSVTSP